MVRIPGSDTTTTKKKRLYLWALLWSGLLFGPSHESRVREWLAIRKPTAYYASTRTVTVTTTISHKPTPLPPPGEAIYHYSLVGCYTKPDGDVLGTGQRSEIAAAHAVPQDQMTIEACFKGCTSLAAPDGGSGRYTHAALRDGK
ncbi:hypothetical protein GGR56DRAFT_642982 [Xylariaceae sp. FL0804]|nr:hypothetical protein GGR56DRAFT_642982 [Xylariaceae sp. FL0804]